MRHVCLLDNKITQKAFDSWKEEDISFWQEHLGITPEYWVIRQDYSDYPTFTDADGDIRPTNAFLKSLNDMVVSKYGDFGTDFIMVMVHEDNWKSDTDFTKGIWGTNYSFVFGKQCLDYCRWDRDNSANTFGTAYHERFHSFDALVKVETGVDVNPILDTVNFDAEIVHGKSDDWDYIRHKENTKALRILKPYLQNAFQKRKDKHEEVVTGYRTIISLATQLLYLLRARQNRKEGVSNSL